MSATLARGAFRDLSDETVDFLARLYDPRRAGESLPRLRVTVALSVAAHLAVLAWPMLHKSPGEARPPLVARLIQAVAPSVADPDRRAEAPRRAERADSAAPRRILAAPRTAPVPETPALTSESAPPAPSAPAAPAAPPSEAAALAVAAEIPPRYDAAYLDNPKPEYPRIARERGIEGRVLLRVLVSVDGSAKQVDLARSSGFGPLDQRALETVRRWRFAPARRGDTALEAWVQVPIVFQLNNA